MPLLDFFTPPPSLFAALEMPHAPILDQEYSSRWLEAIH